MSDDVARDTRSVSSQAASRGDAALEAVNQLDATIHVLERWAKDSPTYAGKVSLNSLKLRREELRALSDGQAARSDSKDTQGAERANKDQDQ